MSHEKSPLDQAVDLVLYAPLGFALEARRLLPALVERGRAQVQMAKVLGRFAVEQGQSQAGTVLHDLGLRPPERSRPQAEPSPASNPEPTSILAPPRSSADAAELPIADYDSLAASQVIPRLGGLDPSELDAVRAYELAHRGRKTILGKVAQLSGE